MKITYIIPSFNRSTILCTTTLMLLDRHKVDAVHLYIEPDQEKEYRLEISKYNFNIKIFFCLIEIKGIGKVRNYIRNSYGTGSNLLMLDDDIKDICIAKDKTLEPLENLQEFVHNMFTLCENRDIYLWGVQLHNNPYFMKKDYIDGLTYVNGSFTGHRINHNLKKIEVNMNHFEDYLFSLKHFIRDKNVLKAGNVCLKTKCFNVEGGICGQLGSLDNRKNEASRNSEILETYFKDLLDVKYSKKYKVDNIKLKNVKWKESYIDVLDIYEYSTPDFFEPEIETNELELENIEEAIENWDL